MPGASATAIEPVTLLLHQPAGFEGNDEALLSLLNASTRWSEDSTEMRMIKKHFIRHSHHFPLPFEAAGLVAFTISGVSAHVSQNNLAPPGTSGRIGSRYRTSCRRA